jgi:Zn-dependent protease
VPAAQTGAGARGLVRGASACDHPPMMEDGPLTAPEASLEAVDAELEKLIKPASNAGQGLWLLVLSAVLFLSVGLVRSQPWMFVVVLLVVLALHELGHLAAMRAFGFSDLRMFFIPFFGAGATGRKIDATGTQRAIVALAGPVSGILLGMVLLLALYPIESEVVGLFVGLMLFLNFFNLLPLLPFDGGRLIHIVLFSRWPGVELVFRLVAALLLAWLAMYRESVIIGAVAAFMALGAGWNAKVAQLGHQLRARVPSPRPLTMLETSPEVRTAAMEDTITTMGLNRYSPQSARNIAVFMTRGWERALDLPPGLTASAVLLAVYIGFLGLGVATFKVLQQG